MKALLRKAASRTGTGFLGTVAITGAFEAANRLLGTKIDLPPALGSVVTGDVRSKATRPAGAAIHFLVGSVALPLAYDAAFRLLGRRDMKTGAAIGAAHGVVSGLLLAAGDKVHPEIVKGTLPPVGAFAKNAGRSAPVAFFLGHVLYGALLGRKKRGFVQRLASDEATGTKRRGGRLTREEKTLAAFQRVARRSSGP